MACVVVGHPVPPPPPPPPTPTPSSLAWLESRLEDLKDMAGYLSEVAGQMEAAADQAVQGPPLGWCGPGGRGEEEEEGEEPGPRAPGQEFKGGAQCARSESSQGFGDPAVSLGQAFHLRFGRPAPAELQPVLRALQEVEARAARVQCALAQVRAAGAVLGNLEEAIGSASPWDWKADRALARIEAFARGVREGVEALAAEEAEARRGQGPAAAVVAIVAGGYSGRLAGGQN
eukprot:tig00000492_g1431.t1